jgi:hypothetical protein
MTCKPYDIPKTLIWEAWLHVKANQGAAGIDAETIERFEKKLGDNLYKLWNRMSSGSYVPPPVKAVPIPKKSGGVRILGIPTVADRIAQTAVKMWLEPRLDPIFRDDSYGYRPEKSALRHLRCRADNAEGEEPKGDAATRRHRPILLTGIATCAGQGCLQGPFNSYGEARSARKRAACGPASHARACRQTSCGPHGTQNFKG